MHSLSLIINRYGAGHGIDHDDGSMMWSDIENVVGIRQNLVISILSNRKKLWKFKKFSGLQMVSGISMWTNESNDVIVVIDVDDIVAKNIT
jgi:hypothetical protein